MTTPGSYVELTESWGMPMPHIEHEMIYRRYKYLADLARGSCSRSVRYGLGDHLLAAVAAELSSIASHDNVDNGQRNAPGVFGAQMPRHSLLVREPRCRGRLRDDLLRPRPRADARRDPPCHAPRWCGVPCDGQPRTPGVPPLSIQHGVPQRPWAAELLRKHGFEPELYGVFRCRTHHGRGCYGPSLGSPRSSISFRRRLPAAVS